MNMICGKILPIRAKSTASWAVLLHLALWVETFLYKVLYAGHDASGKQTAVLAVLQYQIGRGHTVRQSQNADKATRKMREHF